MIGYKTCPIMIGTEAILVDESERILPELSHRWRCYVKATPGLIKSVQFRLHDSFVNPYINVYESPFEFTEHGWGEFTIQIKITLFNDEKLNTNHFLKLHGNSYPLISERPDTVAYKGKEIPVDPEFDFEYINDDEEYKRIDLAIHYLVGLIESTKKR